LARARCSAIPENLLESELFGQVTSSSDPAESGRRGLCEEADGGTLFLDDVENLPGPVQEKLLGMLQEREIRPLGSNETRKVDVRIIAATSSDISARVKSSQFREDLFYRLNVMPLHLPPLRERQEDIPLIAEYLLRCIAFGKQTKTLSLSGDSLELLLSHDWPGNVRELDNTLKRAAALASGSQIRADDIVFISAGKRRLTFKQQHQPTSKSLRDSQRVQIVKALEENDWNCTNTARQLGIGRTTLWRKMKQFNLQQPHRGTASMKEMHSMQSSGIK
jgi:transcriptional regulator with PAS, ATPase and Fis domain